MGAHEELAPTVMVLSTRVAAATETTLALPKENLDGAHGFDSQ
jgi:hypothetical protein